MNGLMQPGPTLYRAEEERKKKGSRGLLGEIGEPMSYAPGPVGLLGNALLAAQYLTGEKPLDEGLSAAAMMTGLLQGTKVAPIMRNATRGARAMTEYEKRHAEAQKNAAKPVSKGGLGLRKDNTAEERATALGFDLDRPLYHGSMHDIRNVDLDRSDIGGYAGRGFYTTPDPSDASRNYASIRGADVKNRVQNAIENYPSRGDNYREKLSTAFYDDKLSDARIEKVLRGTGTGDNLGAVYPVYLRHGKEANIYDPKKSAFLDAGEIYNEKLDEYVEGPDAEKWRKLFDVFKSYNVDPPEELIYMASEGASYGDIWKAIQKADLDVYDDATGELLQGGGLASEALKAIGANTVTHPTHFKDLQLNLAPSHTIAIQPTGIVRSKFAAFDPARRNEADILGFADPRLLAAIGLGSLGLLGYANKDK